MKPDKEKSSRGEKKMKVGLGCRVFFFNLILALKYYHWI